MIRYFCVSVLLLLLVQQPAFAQANPALAREKAIEAIRLEETYGKYDEAIALLAQAQQLDPGDISYPYETALAYSGKKEYKTAANLLEQLLTHEDVNARVYQALGNNYDLQGMPDKALNTYKKGLLLFPASGELYLELGNMSIADKDFTTALQLYEKGIEVAPHFSSNYYRAAQIYCNGEEEVWGMIYGEIFMNLERNSRRTAEISKLLYTTYHSQIKIEPDGSYEVSFSQGIMDIADIKKSAEPRLPYGVGIYEPALALAVAGEKNIDIDALDRIRTHFLDQYLAVDGGKKYPNALFTYQQEIKTAGHLSAYNHWLLMQGDPDGFDAWQTTHQTAWEAFADWFGGHQLALSPVNRFYRAQY